MKYYDTHFEDYVNSYNTNKLHPKLDVVCKLPNSIHDFKNIILYGPKGVGKYTQMLAIVNKYSPGNLKYEKKISITFNKNIYFYKISDVHFEIDLSLLGCNSKLLWNEIFNHVVDILNGRQNKTGIIVCKYFHTIHPELLDSIYSYFNSTYHYNVNIKYILITEEISFIPDNIINNCRIISVPRPSKHLYKKCINKNINADIKLEDITNIKNLQSSITQMMNPHEITCNKIISQMTDLDSLKYNSFRDLLYEIFIYDIDITDCIWFILNHFIVTNKLKEEDMSIIFLKTYEFFKLYNNNYRPIYHLESFMFYLISKIHGFEQSKTNI